MRKLVMAYIFGFLIVLLFLLTVASAVERPLLATIFFALLIIIGYKFTKLDIDL